MAHGNRTHFFPRGKQVNKSTLALLTTLSIALAAALISFTEAPVAEAQRGMRATVYITQAAVPRGLTEKALIGFARGHQARTLAETTDAPLPERRWLGNMVIQLSAPLDDLEYHALYYDVTDGGRDFIDDMAINVHDRTQRTFVQRIMLPRPRFQPNRRIQVVITVRRAEVGRAQFDLRGEQVQNSGVVDFSESDTRAPAQ